MAKQKYTFPVPGCPSCPYHQYVGIGVSETRYCSGFPKKRKPKRFKRSDPQNKPPKWCPRRISPPVCRVYGFVNEESEFTDWLLNRRNYDPGNERCITTSEFRYRLRLELSPHLTAKQFFEATQLEGVHRVLPDANAAPGEVIEIDDGLKPYYFYCVDSSTAVPLIGFNPSWVRPADSDSSSKGSEQ